MPEQVYILWGLAAPLAFLLTLMYRHWAQRQGVVDTPNSRSAHTTSVPRGAGVAFILTFVGLYWLLPETSLAFDGLCLAGVAIATIALIDDLRPLPARVRLGGYAIIIALFLVGFVVSDQVANMAPFPVLVSYPLIFIAVLWHTNLFNFMDGTDGLATIQALTVLVAASSLISIGVTAPDLGQAQQSMLLLAAALAGFLPLNWAPARLFMGDAGSVFLGFMLAGFAVLTIGSSTLGLAVWLILLAAFIGDASYTLIWRMTSGQPFLEGHSLHAYQRVTRLWGSHRRTAYLLLSVNVLWLLPLAWSARIWPELGVWMVMLAYTPLLLAIHWCRRLA